MSRPVVLTPAQYAALGLSRPAPRKARRPPRREEASLLRVVTQWLTLKNIWHERRQAGALWSPTAKRPVRLGVAGSADLMLLISGRAVFVELKSPTGRQRPSQKAWGASVEAAGATYLIARSLQDLVDGLQAAGLGAS